MDLMASVPGIAEAPCHVGDDVWFTDLWSGIYRVRHDGHVDVMVSDRRGVGGLVAHRHGGVVASGRSLIHVRDDGLVSEICCRPADSTGFNDLYTTTSGAVLAGLLRYRPLMGEAPRPGAVVILDVGDVREIAQGPVWPNGIAASSDGTTYVADFATGEILSISSTRKLEVVTTLAEGHADGVAMDTTGRLWVATGPAGTLVALTPDGRVDRRVEVPATFVASIALSPIGGPAVIAVGGREDGTGGLLCTDLGVTGQPIPLAATDVR